jgi:hypothetical protein
MPSIHAPGKQGGTRLPSPLPRPSGAGERRRAKESLRDLLLLHSGPSPAPVAPSLFPLRSPVRPPRPNTQLGPKGVTQDRPPECHLNCEPRHHTEGRSSEWAATSPCGLCSAGPGGSTACFVSND